LLVSDPVVQGLLAELGRVPDLQLPETAPPYFVRYTLLDFTYTRVAATLGGVLTSVLDRPNRSLAVSLRVGSAALDETNFKGRWNQDGHHVSRLPMEPHRGAAAQTAWKTTDMLYKGAVETLARKEAARRKSGKVDQPPSFVPPPGNIDDLGVQEPSPGQALQDRTLALSRLFLTQPQVEWSQIVSWSEMGRTVIMDTAGTLIQQPHAETGLRAVAEVRAGDGHLVTDQVSWIVRGIDDLPSLETMTTEVQALLDRLAAWPEATPLEDPYVGPVIFEGAAAIDVFRYLLLPTLQGTPPEEEEPKSSRRMVFAGTGGSANPSTLSLRRRILPEGWQVDDDPAADLSLPSGYVYDSDGVLGQAVTLVVDGIVRDHYASCTPSEAVGSSNGHGRGGSNSLTRGLPTWTTVTPASTVSDRRMMRQALQLAATYDLDHVLVVRRLEEPAVKTLRSWSGAAPSVSVLPMPIEMVRIYADGREEPVRDASFVGVDRRLLKDLVLAGSSQTATHLMPLSRWSRGPTSGLPVTLTAPNFLVGELELIPASRTAAGPTQLDNPLGG
jgi:hypothetical protein